jgi:cytochrome c oxidase subunit 1
MLFALGFVALFIVGGLSGVAHASPPTDAQQQDTYFIVAHFHYVLFGGSMFGLFAGVYYWWPKFTGKRLGEKLGKWHFWLMFVGMNLTFFPMHWVGLDGMPRRIFTYPKDSGWESINAWVTLGAFIIALSILLFMVNYIRTWRREPEREADPWDGRTLEWSIPSPVPVYNFKEIPTVEYLDDWWAQKYPESVHAEPREGSPSPAGAEDMAPLDGPNASSQGAPAYGDPSYGDDGGHGIHLPDKSYYPLIAAVGLAFFGGSLMSAWWLTLIAGVIMMFGIMGWIFEPVNDSSPDGHAEGNSEGHPEGHAAEAGH